MEFVTEPDVKLLAHSGGDASVIAAARVSTTAADSLDDLDHDPAERSGLIQFLMKNRHGTPFEHNQFRFYVRAGIFVFREFHRHRIGWSYNEESGRYKQLDPVFYVPGSDRPITQVGKPGAYTMVAKPELNGEAARVLQLAYEHAYIAYEGLLALGVAKEVARMCLPVATNSSMYATCNARSLMAFLSLRTESDQAAYPSKPQYEIQQVADRLEAEFAMAMPITHKAFCDFGRMAP